MPASAKVRYRHNQLVLPVDSPTHPYPPQSLERVETSHAKPSGTSPAKKTPGERASERRTERAMKDWRPVLAEPVPISPIETTFRHGGWAARRARVSAALIAAGVPCRRRENFAQCGADAMVEVNSDTGQIRVNACFCKDRFCQPCQQARAARIQRALAERAPIKKCLHIVLTLRSSEQPLATQLARLYKASSKLRAGKFWKSRVAGGSQTLEVTRNEATSQWHPHLHLLVHSDWVPQAELAKEWMRVTGDSSIVHVSLVENHAAAVREVTKYLGKPIHRSIDFQQSSLVELIKALHGKRMIGTFGSWRHDPLLKDDAPDSPGTWVYWGRLNTLHEKAAAGDVWSRQALAYLHSLVPGRIQHEPPKAADSS